MNFHKLPGDTDRVPSTAIQQYDVDYFAQKYGLSIDEARDLLKLAGDSREKADALAAQQHRMDVRGFRAALGQLHWSTLTLADVLGCDAGTTLAWFHGSESVPLKVSAWLDDLVMAQNRFPPPDDFRQIDP